MRTSLTIKPMPEGEADAYQFYFHALDDQVRTTFLAWCRATAIKAAQDPATVAYVGLCSLPQAVLMKMVWGASLLT